MLTHCERGGLCPLDSGCTRGCPAIERALQVLGERRQEIHRLSVHHYTEPQMKPTLGAAAVELAEPAVRVSYRIGEAALEHDVPACCRKDRGCVEKKAEPSLAGRRWWRQRRRKLGAERAFTRKVAGDLVDLRPGSLPNCGLLLTQPAA